MINIATDFSRTPAGRYPKDGPSNGQRFRDELLIPKLKSETIVEIQLDGAAGYPSSFLEEAFGGLVRLGVLSSKDAHARIKLVVNDPVYTRYVKAIWQHIDSAVLSK